LLFPSIIDDSLILVELNKPTDMRIIITTSGPVIDPDTEDLKLSIPKMKRMPEICPASNKKPFEVPSEIGYVISAPYWKPIGPELRRKNPKAIPEIRTSK
jgi:hypothetical protein